MKSLTATSQADPSVAKTYRVEDIAKILDIGRSSAYNLVREGHFKTVRIGTAIRISRKSFDEWLESQAI
ncbi:MAG: helix-turn-helix domain-containing protein [Christensenellales bacterium]